MRLPLIALVMAAILILGAAAVHYTRATSTRRPPDVLLIVLDTVRADAVSGLGCESANSTPFLAALGASGVVFEHARSPSGWTLPAHATLFTGLQPDEHGCHFEHRWLAGDFTTLAELLRDEGYATAGFSSNGNVSGLFHLDQGFDVFFETWRDPRVASGAAPSDVLEEEFVAWLRGRPSRRPFFAFLNLMDAHLPYRPEPGFENPHDPRSELWPPELLAAPDLFDRALAGEVALDDASRAALTARYHSAVRALDQRLERLLERVRRLGAGDDLVVIVTSDHGENLGDHGLLDHQGSLHETVLRVPLLVAGAGVPAGVRVADPVGTSLVFGMVHDLLRFPLTVPQGPPDLPLLALRERPVEILARLAERRPGVDRGALEAPERVAVDPRVEPGRLWKTWRRGGERMRCTAVPAAPAAEDLALAADAPADLLERRFDRALANLRPFRESLVPAAAPPRHQEADLALLRESGYVSAARAEGVGVHAQEHLARGNRAFQRGDLAEARAEYEAAARIAPDFTDAYFNLAAVTEKTAPAEALEAWRRFLDVALRVGGQSDAEVQKAMERVEALGG